MLMELTRLRHFLRIFSILLDRPPLLILGNPGAISWSLETYAAVFSDPTDHPWVSEDSLTWMAIQTILLQLV